MDRNKKNKDTHPPQITDEIPVKYQRGCFNNLPK